MEAAHQDLIDLVSLVEEYRQDHERYEQEIIGLRNRNAELEEEVHMLRDHQDKHVGLVGELEDSITHLDSELSNARLHLSRREGEVEGLRSSLMLTHREHLVQVNSGTMEIDNLKRNEEDMKAALKQKDKEIIDLEGLLDSKEKKISELQNIIGVYETTAGRLQEHYQAPRTPPSVSTQRASPASNNNDATANNNNGGNRTPPPPTSSPPSASVFGLSLLANNGNQKKKKVSSSLILDNNPEQGLDKHISDIDVGALEDVPLTNSTKGGGGRTPPTRRIKAEQHSTTDASSEDELLQRYAAAPDVTSDVDDKVHLVLDGDYGFASTIFGLGSGSGQKKWALPREELKTSEEIPAAISLEMAATPVRSSSKGSSKSSSPRHRRQQQRDEIPQANSPGELLGSDFYSRRQKLTEEYQSKAAAVQSVLDNDESSSDDGGGVTSLRRSNEVKYELLSKEAPGSNEDSMVPVRMNTYSTRRANRENRLAAKLNNNQESKENYMEIAEREAATSTSLRRNVPRGLRRDVEQHRERK